MLFARGKFLFRNRARRGGRRWPLLYASALMLAGVVAQPFRAAERPSGRPGGLRYETPSTDKPAVLRILYIGNSLTTTYNIPAIVGAFGASRGLEIASRVVAFNNYSLEDHWNRGDASRAIAEGGWTIVVLQQGPSALPESRVLLRDYTRRFDAQIRRIGARTALYMVWPSAERSADFEGVKASYAGAARDVGGLLLPVGDAWRAAWRRDGQLELYGADGFHPSPLGAYLAAIVMYQQFFSRSPIGLPSTLAGIVVPQNRAALLQEAAAEADARLGR